MGATRGTAVPAEPLATGVGGGIACRASSHASRLLAGPALRGGLGAAGRRRTVAASGAIVVSVAAVLAGCASGPLGARPVIDDAGAPPSATGDRDLIVLSFDVSDEDLSSVSVRIEFDDGSGWEPATLRQPSLGSVSGNSLRGIRPGDASVTCTVSWDSWADGVAPDAANPNVQIRFTPYDIDGEGASVVLANVSVDNQYPELDVSPLVVSFGEGVEGVTNPPDETITIANVGPAGTDLYWSLAVTGPAAPWLTAPASGGPIASGASEVVTLSATALAAGSYATTITIAGDDGAAPTPNDAHDTPQDVEITFTVRLPRPDIFIHDNAAPTPAQVTDLDFVAVDATGLPIPPALPGTQSFWVENAGETGTVLAWLASDNVTSPDWLAYTPTENVAPGLAVGASEEVVVSVDPSVVGAGHYYATITASGEEITTLEPTLSGDQTVDVHLWVRVPPQIQPSANAVTFSGAIEGYLPPSPAVQTVDLTCGGEVDLAWTAAFVGAPPTWLTFGPPSGAVTAGGVDFDTITLTADTLAPPPPPADLTNGNYSAVIQFQDQYGVTTDVTVSMYVGTRATIVRSPGVLTFSAAVGGSNPANQVVSISNPGDAPLNWTADVSYTTGSGWLQLNFGAPPVSDTCTTEIDQLYVTALTGALPIGTYTATITITDAQATNSPQTIPVTFVVNALTVEILSFVGYAGTGVGSEYQNTLTAISTYFTDFNSTTTVTEDPATLATELVGKQVFLIPEQELSYPFGRMGVLGTAWSTVLTNFVNGGGTVIACSWTKEEHEILNNSGLMTLTKAGTVGSSMPLVEATPHLLTTGVVFPITNPYVSTYSTLTNGTAVVRTQTTLLPVVLYRDLGAGHAVMIGIDYFTWVPGFDRIMANAVQW